MSSITSMFSKKTDRNVIIDPFSCLIKLSLLRFLDSGTKISIYQNRIHFNSPSYVQGFIRFIYGDNREHLHNLYLPIQKCVDWFWNDKNLDMTFMFNNAVIGLKYLKAAYSEYATIQHTLDYYIIILMQKNTNLIAKLGINSFDVEKITNGMIEAENKEPIIETQPNKNNNFNSNFNSNSNSNSNSNNKSSNKESKHKKDDTESKKIGEQQETPNEEIHTKDSHKFLFELWNTREMNIVINLYKEMENKKVGYERDNIYSNIMSYCSMKENKLHQYIEENSSIL